MSEMDNTDYSLNNNKTVVAYNSTETIDAIKLMVLGSMLADYGARLIKDSTKQTLKYRVNCVLQAVKNLEMHFINHSNTGEEHRKAFKKSFNKNETVLLADLNLTCWEINEEGLEVILNAVKQSLTE
jgi:hypothetical protein